MNDGDLRLRPVNGGNTPTGANRMPLPSVAGIPSRD